MALVRVIALRRLGRLRLLVTLLDVLLSLSGLVRGGRRRVQPIDDHPTRERAKDQRAHEQDHADHSESAKDVSYHVTHYQRRLPAERSLKRILTNRAGDLITSRDAAG